MGNTLAVLGRSDEAIASFQQAIAIKPDFAEAHSNLGNTLKDLSRLDEAEASYKQSIFLKPDFAGGHNNLGTTLREQGKLEEALASFKQAIALKPDFVEAHSNLGNVFKDQKRLEEAEVSYRQAIALKPEYAEAHSNLGGTLQELGKLKEAEASFKQAIALKPDFSEAYSNLGITLERLERFDEAVTAYSKAMALKPESSDAHVNFALAIQNIEFTSYNPNLYPALINILTIGNVTRPKNLATSILSLLKHDPLITELLQEKEYTLSVEKTTSIVSYLDELPLLHHLMRLCPLPDLQFERLFVAMRNVFLKHLNEIGESNAIIYFLSTLSLHCFINEYIYAESDEETVLVEALEGEIIQNLDRSEQPNITKILCLASYRPLHQYNWCQTLEALDVLDDVKVRLIEEPLSEKEIALDIPLLGKISDDVSLKVRKQYEESPYPRWVKLGIPKRKSLLLQFVMS